MFRITQAQPVCEVIVCGRWFCQGLIGKAHDPSCLIFLQKIEPAYVIKPPTLGHDHVKICLLNRKVNSFVLRRLDCPCGQHSGDTQGLVFISSQLTQLIQLEEPHGSLNTLGVCPLQGIWSMPFFTAQSSHYREVCLLSPPSGLAQISSPHRTYLDHTATPATGQTSRPLSPSSRFLFIMVLTLTANKRKYFITCLALLSGSPACETV